MRSALVRLVALTAAVLLTGCLSSRPVPESAGSQGSQGQALGTFTVSSETFGEQTFAPSACTAGDRSFFLGGDFTSPSSDLVLRLLVDPLEGPAVRLFSSAAPFDKSVFFQRSECSVFHFSLDTTGWRVNDVYDYRLTLELDCSRPGEKLSGSATTTHCH